ncbi:MAG: helix-turn-helix domain-containing protein [Rhodobiaceae bacterium]|nr:helix-turn-helix domain-containing protein [Rhodobiaceae bacterium]MCC0056550.1 helix-turn-helix domain-containing protein [Rhodobiaceae bacterium]
MDSLINAASRALATGDALTALKRIGTRDDAPALALRGIAMAQLGDLERARDLLRQAGRAFGPREPASRARCVVGEAEIALVSRDLGQSLTNLGPARRALAAYGDRRNAAHAAYLEARLLLLIGRLDDAEALLGEVDIAALPTPSHVGIQLVRAGIAIRRLDSRSAKDALANAMELAGALQSRPLLAEVERAAERLSAPVAREVGGDRQRLLYLEDVEAVYASDRLVIDACRNCVRSKGYVIPLTGRSVLFTLVRVLAEAWPGSASREALLWQAFRAREADESHRARLRVEIGRLRGELRDIAEITATENGFMMIARDTSRVIVLAPPVEREHAHVLALLADGEAWSSSALALALSVSPRTVQRALESLAAQGEVEPFGRGRARRWIARSVPGFPTSLLLPAASPLS